MEKPILRNDRKKLIPNHAKPGFVYIFRDNQAGLCKIGLSRTPKRRRYYLSREYQSPLQIMAIAPTLNMKFTERLMHQMFARYHQYRSPGLDGFTEWFKLSTIRTLIAQITLYGITLLMFLGCLVVLAIILILFPIVLSW